MTVQITKKPTQTHFPILFLLHVTFVSLCHTQNSNPLKFHSYFFYTFAPCLHTRTHSLVHPLIVIVFHWNYTGVSSVVFSNEPAKSFFSTKPTTSVTCEQLIVIHLTGFFFSVFYYLFE